MKEEIKKDELRMIVSHALPYSEISEHDFNLCITELEKFISSSYISKERVMEIAERAIYLRGYYSIGKTKEILKKEYGL